jgi:hypothetical protein
MTGITEDKLVEHQKNVGGKRVTLQALKGNIAETAFYTHAGGQLTIAILTLKNGFTVTGQSACADPAMYNKEIGEKIALADAESKIWPLMGYALKEEMYLSGASTFQERLVQESVDLKYKIDTLDAFMGGEVQFERLPDDEQVRLSSQRLFMDGYYSALLARINCFK